MIKVDATVKNVIYVKKIIFEILLHVVAKSVIDNSVITCDKIIDEETKTVTAIFNEKNAICSC